MAGGMSTPGCSARPLKIPASTLTIFFGAWVALTDRDGGRREGSGLGNNPPKYRGGFETRPYWYPVSGRFYDSSLTGLRRTPMPLMSISQTAPSAMSWVVPGVPVKMQSPGSSVT